MPDSSAPVRLASAATALTRFAGRSSGATGLGAQAGAVWTTLAELRTSSPARLGELAERVRVTQPTMTGIIARLDEAGWIRRVHDENDGRAWLIEGTAAGFTALGEHRLRLESALAPLFDDLDDDEHQTIERAAAIVEARVARITGTSPTSPQKGQS
ncbi:MULTISPECIES: MarR family winged helix-turn-helix transcriptional regulator [unclassified Rathayibacter]|uniref:MarR family winged helix-turn-helix transcriptional regulator n=1 Tax=unclassified Rathayibacter TaxID=2609250 RepID=UPI00188C7D2F|nr:MULTISPECIES: MarR family transcriptional regulator [unclassified Rathayibacter]MBF4461347.1 MarR family transcriptional regulator [Rathayibacter sp. VKM Ac-2879]MBF4502758.1 MarR family transcriptional regulator [Rathayibacter sp. VKM Ac-2878]